MKNVGISPHQLSVFEREKLVNPTLSDEQAVREICARLLREADARAPADVELLASMRGIGRVEETVQDYAGMLVQQAGGLVAHVRRDDGVPRKRFTVLHEAGHTL